MANEVTRSGWWAYARLVVLLAVLVALFVVEQRRGWDDAQALRDLAEGAGAWGALAFAAGYAALVLLPAPKAVLTVLAGAIYGVWWGALLSWSAALVGATLAFALARAMGRDAVDRLTRGRTARADAVLAEHGLGAVVAVRLVPVLPFTVINYAAGVTALRWPAYLLGSALGMVPGSLAYAAVGAWGTDPWGLFSGVAALVLLVVVGSIVGRRLVRRNDERPTVGAGEEAP